MTKYDETSTTTNSKPFNTFRKSRIKRTTDAGKVATILKCNTVDIKVAEIFALAQPDAIWLCMEHGSLDYNQAENQSNAAKIYDVDSLLRVNRGSYSNYIRGLEVDCTGLIIPQIKNLADAKSVVYSTGQNADYNQISTSTFGQDLKIIYSRYASANAFAITKE